MSNWKIEVSIPAVRVRYIYYHRADTQSQVHVSIPAARVRYIHHQRRQKGDSQGFNSRSAGKIHSPSASASPKSTWFQFPQCG